MTELVYILLSQYVLYNTDILLLIVGSLIESNTYAHICTQLKPLMERLSNSELKSRQIFLNLFFLRVEANDININIVPKKILENVKRDTNIYNRYYEGYEKNNEVILTYTWLLELVNSGFNYDNFVTNESKFKYSKTFEIFFIFIETDCN